MRKVALNLINTSKEDDDESPRGENLMIRDSFRSSGFFSKDASWKFD